jgi:MarR family 2-MHQ and catechol resistance regulon transcriptional repressor
MQKDIVSRMVDDLLSVPPLIFRGIRRKMLKTVLVGCEADISPLHFEIMLLLRKEKGTLKITEIGERLLVARAQMTHLIDNLVKEKMVERQADSTDRRVTNIVLTARGSAFLEEHGGNIRKAVAEILDSLSDKELADLSASLERMREILSRLQ